MIRVGVDVGGTNTDAVVMRGQKFLGGAKRPTTQDIFGFFLKRDGIEFSFTRGIFDVLKPLLAK